MIIKRLEKEDLKAINKIRNDNIQYIRQHKPHNMMEQEQWFSSTTDTYFSIFNDDLVDFDTYKLVGAIGITNCDMVSRKCELSLITEGYIKEEYCKPALDFIYNYSFRILGMNKIYMPVYDFDQKKKELLEKEKWHRECEFIADVYYDGSYHNSIQYCLFKRDYL